jgi:hypothetical protein
MAYVGQGIKGGTFSVLDTSGNTYNGSNVTFDLGTQVSSPAQLLVSHDGVIQKPVTDYTIATGGTQITFTTAPASGASIFITEISGAVGAPMNRDINGDELILDADADTSITADTDDQIDVRVGGSDIATLTSSALTLKNSATADNSTFTVNLQTAEADIAADDVLAKINFQAPNEGTGTDANLIAASIQATSEGDFSSSSNATKLEFMTGASEAATTKMSISSGGNVAFNSGFGSVTTVFGCRAWAKIDQTGTTEIDASGNVSSVTDTGTGATDVNFTTNMPDTDYCMSISPGTGLMATANQQFPVAVGNDGGFNTSKGVIGSRQCDNDAATFTTADAADICVAFFR